MGRNSFFQFKQFKVEQSECAMKVGTDGVLLGAWCDVDDATNILDIGTGTGLIALMVAQRNKTAHIFAIDLDEKAVKQAQENIDASPWSDRMETQCCALQEFTPATKFDLIVCNPPYFTNSLKAPDQQRTLARHNDSLPLDELAKHAVNLLNEHGRLCVILPTEEGQQLVDYGRAEGLALKKITEVVPKPDGLVKRWLIEMTKDQTEFYKDSLQIELENRHEYTEAFKALTKDFYLDK